MLSILFDLTKEKMRKRVDICGAEVTKHTRAA